ncbi:hypothetical protein TVAG_088450 [Trichomonas vaginalis G3]|uniref:MatE family protein n=1 Tax=Trichomonas vaginalis (strain ATCC PRA-98 / G3) TaxID=412133 RepID=A2EAZ0_TRIV3|nr:multidrug resistance protein YPNP-related family [Trichomonas vaginalis G3]EAY10130.1 hypothetical protein TVAG_088450 [Trichomonas vaginalis G3]KAI5534494.1 multidrug resistance protein YPNP-related family [Trichomonas vaginalis G3]|eukprot:XP_001322353.1 hypothetical protein [Trichomonas vaginalis G3]
MNSGEIYRLSGRPPLKTILLLSIGPLCSQITSTLYGIINTFWISKYVGEVGMSAVATVVVWEFVARAFGLFLSIAASTQISSLFGKKLFDDAKQVVCDLYRVALICGCIVPAILIPAIKPYARWCLATEETTKMAFRYILPQAAGNALTCIFYTNIGVLQAEGRTLLVGIIDVVALGLGMGALNPLFMGKLKIGIIGPSISTIIADGVPGIILTILFFCGRFGTKPELKGLIKPFNKHTFQGLVVGSSQFISQLSTAIPAILMRRVMGKSLLDKSQYDLMISGLNVAYRYTTLETAIILGICTGFLAPGSYAYAAKLFKRYLHLSIHLNWITLVWCIFTNILAFTCPRQIAKIFGHDEKFLEWAEKEIKAANWAAFLMFIRFTLQSMLQSLQRGKRAMIVSMTSSFITCLASIYIIDAIHPHQPEKVVWCFWLASCTGLVIGGALIFKPLYDIIKESRKEKISASDEKSSKDNKSSKDGDNEIDNFDDSQKDKDVEKDSAEESKNDKIDEKQKEEAEKELDNLDNISKDDEKGSQSP